MTKTAEAAELARRFMEFIDEVKAGHEVLVTQGQEPVARLVPMSARRSHGRRSVAHLRPLTGQWKGETVLKSGDLAAEMFDRE
jgi:prevent-host-death family protein